MKNFILIVCLFCFSLNGMNQNLVPNYSFENYTSCPTAGSQINYAIPWIGTNNSTDYYNACAPAGNLSVPCQTGTSFQYAKTGNAFAGLYMIDGFAPYREYLQVMLLDSLQKTKCYFIRYYVNLHNKAKYAVNNFGVYFSDTAFSTPTWGLPPYIPQILGFNNLIINDTLNWVPIEGIYIANGGEEYITLGNFSDDANTDTLDTGNGTSFISYYYFDDVSVTPIDSIPEGMPAFAGNDTSVVLGDSVFIGQQITNLNCNWYDSTGVLIASNISGIYVHPPKSTYYIVEQNLCGTITYDSVHITVLPVGINERNNQINFNLYPNPATKNITIEFDLAEKENLFLEIKNVLGQTVKMINNTAFTKGSTKIEVDISGFSSGLYFVQLKSANNIITKKFIKE